MTILDAMQKSAIQMQELMATLNENQGNYRYEPGKWTIREVLCHILDAERIFAYRALRFARNDKTPLAGFDEQLYVPESNADQRTIVQIAGELKRVRETTIDLFKSFSPAMLERTGTANNAEMSVLALGYIVPGHETHHRHVLLNRYLGK
jgi:uncharacterized damage-inducible protein DinB